MRTFNAVMRVLVSLIAALLAVPAAVIGRYGARWACSYIYGRDIHIDVPLSNMAVQAFRQGNLVGQRLFPVVPVGKQSDKYYTIQKADWMRLPDTDERAPKNTPRRIEFSVSSDSYFAKNYALAAEAAFEDLANQDNAIRLRERNIQLVTSRLALGMEKRIASKVTSITNCGSGIALTGTAKWSNYTNSNPLADVTTGHAFMRSNTGIRPNVAIIDFDTLQILKRHPVLLDMYKYTDGGMVTMDQIKASFEVSEIIVAEAIYNNAKEGAAATMTNIWGNVCLLAYVDTAAAGPETATYGLGYRWTDPLLGQPMAARVYDDPDPGKRVEIQEASYYQDEKIVAQQLSYLVKDTL